MDTVNATRSIQKPNSNFPCPKIKKPEKNKRESIGRPKKLINSRNLKKKNPFSCNCSLYQNESQNLCVVTFPEVETKYFSSSLPKDFKLFEFNHGINVKEQFSI